MILCSNPQAQYRAHKREIDSAVGRVLEGGRYILGEEVQNFETEFARYIGVTYGVGVGSGTEALHVALVACGVGPGDEAITVSHTAVATVAAIDLAGARPVLVDVDPHFYTLDPRQLEAAITSRTKAIVPVHLYGQPADLAPIMEIANRRGVRVIEDCAQAHGARYAGRRVGGVGDMGCFSFYPTKNLGAMGDGGIVVTNDADLAERCRLLREYGWKERYVSQVRGWNSRLDEVQAAILGVKLRFLDEDNAKRGVLAARYDEALGSLKVVLPRRREGSTHVNHLYVVRCSKRDRLQAFLKNKGIHALIHYPAPVHRQPAFARQITVSGKLSVTESICQEALSLPIYPELSAADLEAVTRCMHDFFRDVRS